MDVKLVRAWIKVLRSGKYKQGPGRLRNQDNGTHCCLGVLCEVIAKRDRVPYETAAGPRVGLPTNETLERVGLHPLGKGPLNLQTYDLTQPNDNPVGQGHMSFKGIALLVERQLNKYLKEQKAAR